MSSHGDDAITASSSLASVQVGRGSEQRTIGSTRRISGRAGAGRLIGSFIYTPYLFVMHVVFKKHATPRVLRPSLRASSKLSAMHIDTDRVLTVYPIGVRRVTRRLRHVEETTHGEPRQRWIEPVDRPIEPHVVEPPLRFDPDA